MIILFFIIILVKVVVKEVVWFVMCEFVFCLESGEYVRVVLFVERVCLIWSVCVSFYFRLVMFREVLDEIGVEEEVEVKLSEGSSCVEDSRLCSSVFEMNEDMSRDENSCVKDFGS